MDRDYLYYLPLGIILSIYYNYTMTTNGKRVAYWLVLAAGLSLMAASCSEAEYPLKDGYYCAEAAEYDAFGWKEFVTIRVSSGKIIIVEYNAFNKSGFIKSWDMDYMRVMNASDGTYPNAYTRHYGRQFLENQGTQGVDLLSGATHSYHSFLQLAQAVLENARRGDPTTERVPLKEINVH